MSKYSVFIFYLGFLISHLFEATSVYSQNHETVKIDYKNGLKLKLKDTIQNVHTEISFGGRIHYDLSFLDQSEAIDETVGTAKNGQQFRRIFLLNAGKLFYGKINYKIQFDFTGGNIGFRDVYIEPRLLHSDKWLAYLRVGQFKDPFRFENLLSSNNITLIERSYIQSFAPLRNTGLMFHMNTSDKQFSFQLAFMNNSNDAGVGLLNEGDYNITTRFTYLLFHQKEMTFHTGIGYSLRKRGEKGTYSLKVKPPVQLLPSYITFSVSDVNDVHILNLETAIINKQFMFISEYLYSRVNFVTQENFKAFYGQLSYLLNKDSRHIYHSSLTGIQDKIGKGGAWEIALRYSLANFTENVTTPSSLSDLTFGMNYYLNDQFRIMLNFAIIHLESIGKARAINMRLQCTF